MHFRQFEMAPQGRHKDVIQRLSPYLYIDSTKSVITTSSGLVTSVSDLSGNGRSMTTDTGREPGLATPASWSGRKILDLTDTTRRPILYRTSTAISQPITVLWVGDVSNYSGNALYPGQFSGHSTNGDYFDAYMRADNKTNVFYQGAGTTTTGIKDISSPTVGIYVANGAGASGMSFLGKGAGAFRRNLTLTAGPDGIYNIIIVGNDVKVSNATSQMGYLRSFAVWTRALTTAEMDQIEAYFMAQHPGVFA